MNTLEKIKKIPNAFGFLCGSLIFVIFVLMVAEVILRNFFNSPITGVSEICIYLHISAVYFGISYTQLNKGHIAVDLVYDRLSEKGKAVLDTLSLIICTVVFVIFCACSWKAFAASYAIHEIYLSAIKMPLYLLKLCIAIGLSVMVVQLVVDLIEQLVKSRAVFQDGRTKEDTL